MALYDSKVIANYSSPLFIDKDDKRIWVAVKTGGNLELRYSDNYGDNWVLFKSFAYDNLYAPASIFVSTAGDIYVCDTFIDSAHSGRVHRIDHSTKAVTIAFNLTSNLCHVMPWAWCEDLAGNIYAGQYGWNANFSYIHKLNASGSGHEVSAWALADAHIHTIRVNINNGKMYVTAGDSPRRSYVWNGNIATMPTLLTFTLPAGYYDGFTGLTFLSDGMYTGDDNDVDKNFIRKFPITADGTNNPNGTVILDMPYTHDTPIYCMSASGDNELWFINSDEWFHLPEKGERSTGVHLLKRTAPGQPFAYTIAKALPSYIEGTMEEKENFVTLCVNRYGLIPEGHECVYVASGYQSQWAIRRVQRVETLSTDVEITDPVVTVDNYDVSVAADVTGTAEPLVYKYSQNANAAWDTWTELPNGSGSIDTPGDYVVKAGAYDYGAWHYSSAVAFTVEEPPITIQIIPGVPLLYDSTIYDSGTYDLIEDKQAPAPPGNLRVVVINPTSLKLVCDQATDNALIRGYNWYNFNEYPSKKNADLGSGTEFTFTDLRPGRLYELGVEAVDSSGNTSVVGILKAGTGRRLPLVKARTNKHFINPAQERSGLRN